MKITITILIAAALAGGAWAQYGFHAYRYGCEPTAQEIIFERDQIQRQIDAAIQEAAAKAKREREREIRLLKETINNNENTK